ncbi:MAG TPA: hypothetical protein VK530_02520 [Candidatus Acidoferrum sp.]|nr:hypothetical protein [Candidatus Acidoferrum sp.]
MKRFVRIVTGAGAVALFLLLFGKHWDYGFNCTRCLYYEHRIEHRPFFFTLFETTMNRDNRYERIYLELFQRPCTHAMKTGGFGHSPGCGMTAEGSVFSGRNKAVKSLFEAYWRIPDAVLARESFTLVETLFPERTTVKHYHSVQHDETNTLHIGNMHMYGEWIDAVETAEEWRSANDAARQNFNPPPAFLKDEKRMRAKSNSPSSIVREATYVKAQPKPE